MANDPRSRPPRRPAEDDEGSQFRRPRGLLIWLLLIGGVILAVSLAPSRMGRGTRHETTFDEVVDAVRAGKVESILVHGTTL